jgi:hypothetical protein
MTIDQAFSILATLIWVVVGAVLGLFLQAWYAETDSRVFRWLKVFVKTIRLNKQNPELEFVLRMRPSDLDTLSSLDLHLDALAENIRSIIVDSGGKTIREKQPDDETLELEANWFGRDYKMRVSTSSQAPRAFEFLEHSDVIINEAGLILLKPAEGVTDFLLTIERKTNFKSIREEMHDIMSLGLQIRGQLAPTLGSAPSFHFILNYPKGFAINLGQTKASIRQAELGYPDGVTVLISENRMVASYPPLSRDVTSILETVVLYSR